MVCPICRQKVDKLRHLKDFNDSGRFKSLYTAYCQKCREKLVYEEITTIMDKYLGRM